MSWWSANSQIQLVTSFFFIAHRLRITFIFLNVKSRGEKKKCGSQSLKCLLLVPLQEKFAKPWSKAIGGDKVGGVVFIHVHSFIRLRMEHHCGLGPGIGHSGGAALFLLGGACEKDF